VGAPTIRLHRSRTLIARTLLDLAATTPPDRLERALAQAERLRLYDYTAIRD